MRLWLRHQQQHGDTIVEVLIAVAVISSVLAGAFLVAQKSAAAVRDSQEHAEMAQILQGQVELVRALALTQQSDSGGVYGTSPSFPPYFCIDTTATNYGKRININGMTDYKNPTQYPATSPCNNLQGLYKVAITYDKNSKVFRFYGIWDHVGGGKMNSEQMSYRIYPGQQLYNSSP